ncbi:TonB-dependent receptor [Phenylobacterium sp. LjRoot225]|uniref:TonB-dependent receptor plug domain-containing protein n=1 Tax=Phenylobacterium sp. LjRoot225 TaxID=3342285 RepID=UPI003ECF61F4
MKKSKSILIAGASGLALLCTTASSAAAQTAAKPSEESATVDTVIVTGTRTTGLRAVDSAAPIQVLGAQALARVGQPDLIQGLAQTVPSFTAEAFGGDTANLTLSARLRGLSPNHALVLVNGKRRHPTANLHVLGGPYQGAATADLSLIPVAAIDHVEVLQDGAAAQYGTDAIAGVINIILKDKGAGGVLEGTAGQYYKGDGETGSLSGNFGAPLGENGFINLTAELRFHDFSHRGGADARVSDVDGNLLPSSPASWAGALDYPRVNHILGDAQQTVNNASYNAGYDLGAVQLYSFGSFSYRRAEAYENYRVPSRVIASPVLGVRGSYTAPGELIFAPLGFHPKEALRETDYAVTGGAKGAVAGWNWDLSSTYGKDIADIYTRNSANAALFVDTHFTPTEFYDGTFESTQWTSNLDLSREFDVGLAGPLNVAFGAEYRWEKYAITQGDAASIYKEGGQSYPGFQPTDAGGHSRKNYSAYIDLATNPIANLKVDVAGRYEHYSDFGSTTVGKLTTRYDFNPAFALRGTASTGFRAPTLAESFYSATNVGPTTAFVQMPPNSDAAALLGFAPLKPEKSTNFSVGFVAHPVEGMTVTLDAYQIKVSDRIIGSGSILGQVGSTVVSQAVLDAIAAHGNVLDPTVTFVGTTLFANGADTRTRGMELMVTYHSDFDDWGSVDWSLAGNYNKTTITNLAEVPAPLAGAIDSLLSPTAISDLTTASPKAKVTLGAFYAVNRFTVNVRETIYGPVTEIVSPDGTGSGADAYKSHIGTTAITDIDVAYKITDSIKVAVGANNLFNKKPPKMKQFGPTGGLADGSNVYDAPLTISPWGINGGYYYTKLTYTF